MGSLILLFGTGCMEALQPGVTPGGPPAPIGGIRPTQVSPTLPPTVPATSEPAESSEPVAPSATSASTAIPNSNTPVTTEPIIVPTQMALSYEERWRAQQVDRMVFPQLQDFTSSGTELWWYDPVNQQAIVLGYISGTFPAQAEFTLRSNGQPALEIPYEVNVGYGLTALSPAALERIEAAGYGSWIETFVYRNSSVTPR